MEVRVIVNGKRSGRVKPVIKYIRNTSWCV